MSHSPTDHFGSGYQPEDWVLCCANLEMWELKTSPSTPFSWMPRLLVSEVSRRRLWLPMNRIYIGPGLLLSTYQQALVPTLEIAFRCACGPRRADCGSMPGYWLCVIRCNWMNSSEFARPFSLDHERPEASGGAVEVKAQLVR